MIMPFTSTSPASDHPVIPAFLFGFTLAEITRHPGRLLLAVMAHAVCHLQALTMGWHLLIQLESSFFGIFEEGCMPLPVILHSAFRHSVNGDQSPSAAIIAVNNPPLAVSTT
jgi:hypothetical protein